MGVSPKTLGHKRGIKISLSEYIKRYRSGIIIVGSGLSIVCIYLLVEYIPEIRDKVVKGIRGQRDAKRLLTMEILKNTAIILASGVAIFFGADYLIKEADY